MAHPVADPLETPPGGFLKGTRIEAMGKGSSSLGLSNLGSRNLGSSGWRFALFTVLYLYQGLVAGFALTALANHFAAAGVSTAEIGRHVAIVGLPWVLQPLLWGPVIDRATPIAWGRAVTGSCSPWPVGRQVSRACFCSVRPRA